jgi:hypothetical protein
MVQGTCAGRGRTDMTPRTAIQLLALLAASAAQAATLSTPPLHPDPDGRLVCTVVNVGNRDLAIQAGILDDAGQNVTEFASTQYQDGPGDKVASVTVDSAADAARYCRVTVSGGGRSQVRASLEAFDANGVRTAVVEAR